MKLQMYDQYSFQTAMGYEDDPLPMTEEEVSSHIKYWRESLQKLLDSIDGKTAEQCDLELLCAFLGNALEVAEVEYTNPAQEYEYTAIFEYGKSFNIYAHSQEEADKLAKWDFYKWAKWTPDHIDCATVNYKALDRDSDGRRIAEQL